MNILLKRDLLMCDSEDRRYSTSLLNMQSHLLADCVMRNSPNMRTRHFFFTFRDNTQIVWPFLERKIGGIFTELQALPYGLYGMPSITGNWSPEKGTAILKNLMNRMCISLVYVENPAAKELPFSLPRGITANVTEVYTHLLDLSCGWSTIWSDIFSKKLRGEIKRSEKSQLVIREGDHPGDIEKFYKLYNSATIKWGHESPPYSYAFFTELLNSCNQFIKLTLVEDQGKTIAGAIFIEEKDFDLYWFGVMDDSEKLKYPMYALISNKIRESSEKGKNYFNFGASGSLTGVREFKEKWGGKLIPYKVIRFQKDWIFRVAHRMKSFKK